jgi:uncharacterized protein (TIGR02145 family)
MKKIIYTILSITMLTACKKESSNPTTTPTNSTSTAISKYGNGVTDIEGNKYKTVIIGTQEWMAENLKVSKYNDGTQIPNVTDREEWSNLTRGAWTYYNNDGANNAEYGKLYNWYAVSSTTNEGKNICPTGWHIPTDTEWKILTNYLGGDNIAAGGKLKEEGVSSWNSPNTDATNSSLFSALPGGGRYSDANFGGIGSKGYWWSSSEYSTDGAWYLLLNRSTGVEEVSYEVKKYGLSVRCLKD